MATINMKNYSSPRNINLKDGCLRFGATNASTPFDSTSYGLYINSANKLVFSSLGSDTTLTGSGGGSIGNWDTLYDNDKTLTIDDTSLVFSVTADVDGITINGSADVDSGALLQFASSGDAKDIQGTSDSWNVSKVGLITCVGITNTSDITTTGAAVDWDLIDNNASALSFDATDKAGIIAIVTTDSSEGVTMSGILTVAGTLTASTGIVTSDGTSTFDDDANDANTITITNDTMTTWGNATDAGLVQITAAKITTAFALNVSLDESELNGGGFLRCWHQDSAAAVFTIGESGNTTIAGTNGATTALSLTTGNLILDDSDASKIESENGATTLLTLDNKAGAIGSGAAVLKVDAGGVVNAAGFGIYATFTGSAAAGSTVVGIVPVAGTLGLKINAGGLATREALYIDADPTAHDVAYIHSDAVIHADKALLTLQSAGAIASGGNVLRVDVTGTPASGAVYTEFDFAGFTDTHENVGVLIDASAKKVQALKINAAPTAGSTILATSTGVLAADKATCELVSNAAACNADSAVLRVEQTATDGVATCMALKQDDIDKPFITFESTIGTGDAVEAVGGKTVTHTHFIMVDIEGVGTRYIGVGTIG